MSTSNIVYELMAKLVLDSTEYEQGMKDARDTAENGGGGIKRALGTAAKAGAAALAAASSAAVAFGKSAIDAGMSFDASMSQVKAISGANADEFQLLRNKAQEMGATTKFSATEAADAMNYMAMAGWKTQDMLDGISGIMNLAAASGEDLATTSDIVTDALTAFGMTAQDSGHFADILASAATNANTNVGMMGDTFKYVAPVAGSLGYSAEDMAVAIGLMANSGIKASQAGTALRGILTRMAKPTKESAEAMGALGISLDDGHGNMYSFMEIMEQLRSGFKNNLVIPQEEVTSSLERLNAKLKDGTLTQAKYDEAVKVLMDRAYSAEGALMAEYAAMLAGQEGMSGLLAIVNASDEDFAKLTESIEHASDTMVMTADGSIMSMAEALEKGVEWVQEFNGSAEAMSSIMEDNLQGDITSLKSAFEGLQVAVSDRLTPAMRDFVQFGRDGIRELTVAFKRDGLQGALDAMGPIIDQGIGLLFEALPKALEAGIKLLEAVNTGIINNLPKLIEAGLQIVMHLVSSIQKNIGNLVEASVTIITTLADGIVQMLPQLIPAIVEIVLTIVNKLTEPSTLTQLVMAAVQIIVALANGLIQAIPQLLEAVPQIISNLVGAIVANLPQILSAGVQLLVALVTGIVGAIPQLVALAPEIVAALAGGIVQGISTIIDTGRQLVDGFLKGIKDSWNGMVENVKRFFSNFIDNIKGLFGIHSPSTVFADIGRNLIAGFINGIRERVSSITDQIRSLKESISRIFQSLADAAGSWGRDLIGNFVDGLKGKLESLKNQAIAIAQQIKNVIGFSEPKEGPLSQFHTFAPDMMELFAKGIKDNANIVTNAVSDNFNFRDQIGAGFNSGTVVSMGGARSVGSGSRTQTIILQVGRTELARLVHELNGEEDERIGLKLVTT